MTRLNSLQQNNELLMSYLRTVTCHMPQKSREGQRACYGLFEENYMLYTSTVSTI